MHGSKKERTHPREGEREESCQKIPDTFMVSISTNFDGFGEDQVSAPGWAEHTPLPTPASPTR